MVSTMAAIITGIGAVLGLTGGFVGFLALPKIVKYQIEESFKLLDGSETYKIWKTLRIPVVYKIYFFNVSNPDDVQKGAKPIVKEIGPYVYNQYRKKIDVTRKDDVLSYYQYERFEFDEKASAPLKDGDEITVVNLPLMSILTMAEYNAGIANYQLRFLDYSIPTIFNNPTSIFLKTTPRDFLFDGVDLMCDSFNLVDSMVCHMIGNYAPAMLPRLEDGRFRFSIYGYKNDTRGDYYSINSGLTDIYQLGEILAWNNASTIDTWLENGSCDKISGTDAALFPPYRTEKSVLKHFNTDICRTVNLKYAGNVTFAGVDGYRYLFDENTFASPSNYSSNKCFCLGGKGGIRGDDGCLLDGVIEISECLGAPVFISLPHFYLANEVYQNGVYGVKPNESLHTMFVDVEPLTGVFLRGSKKAQVNIFIRPFEWISLTSNLPTTLMPVLWIDESFELDDIFVNLLISKVFDVLDLLSIIKWSAVIGGVLLFSCGLPWVLTSMWGPTEFSKLV